VSSFVITFGVDSDASILKNLVNALQELDEENENFFFKRMEILVLLKEQETAIKYIRLKL